MTNLAQAEIDARLPFPVCIGMDELATETAKCEGWTYFCLPELYVPDFNRDAAAILASSRLHSFHGKKYKTEFEDEYYEFLKLIRLYTEKSLQTRTGTILYSAEHRRWLLDISESIGIVALAKTGTAIGTAWNQIATYVPPLLCLTQFADELGPKIEMRVEMDECTSLKDLALCIPGAYGTIHTAQELLQTIYNGYAAKKSPRLPLLASLGINTMPDSRSFLIQAADVFGNFSMALTFAKLGDTSKKRQEKARLIERVFSDRMPLIDFSGALTLTGNDFVLRGDKESVKFISGWWVNDNKQATPPEVK